MDEITFKLIKTHVADYYNDNHCLVMLKVLFKDHIEPQKLSNITDTINLLNALYEKSLLSCKDLALLYNAIKLTGHFALQDKIKATWTSFPDVREIAVTEFTEHRQKLMRFGQQVIQTDVRRIDGLYNTSTTKNYKDSWEMIHHLEDKNFIKEDMTEFIARLKQLDLPKAVDALERPIKGCTPECQKETEHSTNARPIYNLSESEYAQLLVNVSDCWSKFGDINMLKVLLCDFNRIGITEIQKEDDVFNLFNLLRGSGKLSPSNIDVIAEAAFLCGVGPIEEIIKKKIPTYQYPASMDEVHKVSKYRRNVIEFGFKVEATNLKTILKLSNLSHIKETDKWRLILSLELNSKLTPKNKETFVKMLRENDMTAEVDALNTY